jgi:hypothetical protein
MDIEHVHGGEVFGRITQFFFESLVGEQNPALGCGHQDQIVNGFKKGAKIGRAFALAFWVNPACFFRRLLRCGGVFSLSVSIVLFQ